MLHQPSPALSWGAVFCVTDAHVSMRWTWTWVMACGGLSCVVTPPKPPHRRPGSARRPGYRPRSPPPPRRVLTPATRARMHASPTCSLQISHLPRGHTHRHAHTPLLPTPRRRFAPSACIPTRTWSAPGPAPALSDPSTRRMNANCVSLSRAGYASIDANRLHGAQISKFAVPLEAHALPNLPGTVARLTRGPVPAARLCTVLSFPCTHALPRTPKPRYC